MKTYYITYRVYEDNYKYCAYITAENEKDAKEELIKLEEDLKVICGCEIAY